MTRPHKSQWIFVPLALTLIVSGLAVLVVAWLRPDVTVSGVADGGSITPQAVRHIEITALGRTDGVQVWLDGEPANVRRDGNRIELVGDALPAGPHTLTIMSPDAAMPVPGLGTFIRFTVDDHPAPNPDSIDRASLDGQS